MLKAHYDAILSLHLFWAGNETVHTRNLEQAGDPALGGSPAPLTWPHLLPGGGAALPDAAAHGHPAGRGDPAAGPGSDHR